MAHWRLYTRTPFILLLFTFTIPSDVGLPTKTYIVNLTTSTELIDYWLASRYRHGDLCCFGCGRSCRSLCSAYYVTGAPQVDLKATGTGTTDAGSTKATGTSNSAARVTRGMGMDWAVLSISLAVIVLSFRVRLKSSKSHSSGHIAGSRWGLPNASGVHEK